MLVGAGVGTVGIGDGVPATKLLVGAGVGIEGIGDGFPEPGTEVAENELGGVVMVLPSVEFPAGDGVCGVCGIGDVVGTVEDNNGDVVGIVVVDWGVSLPEGDGVGTGEMLCDG